MSVKQGKIALITKVKCCVRNNIQKCFTQQLAHMSLVRAFHLCFFPCWLVEMSQGSKCKFSHVSLACQFSTSSFARSPLSGTGGNDDVSLD